MRLRFLFKEKHKSGEELWRDCVKQKSELEVYGVAQKNSSRVSFGAVHLEIVPRSDCFSGFDEITKKIKINVQHSGQRFNLSFLF